MRTVRSILLGASLIIGLSACEMTVRFTTQLEEDGSGAFAVGVSLNQDARDIFELVAARGGDGADGIAAITTLFDGLARDGWEVERSEPAGGLALEATTTFADTEDFSRVLEELRTARTSEGTGLQALTFTLDVDSERSFMRSTAGVSGVLDMSGIDLASALGERLVAERLIAELQQALRLEIRAELPGAVGDLSGPATVGEGVVVWRPVFGSSTTFAATSSSLRVGNLLLVLIPVLVLLAAIGWVLIGRRRAHDDDDLATVLDDDLLVLKAEPNGNGSRDRDALGRAIAHSNGSHPMEIDLREVPQSDADA